MHYMFYSVVECNKMVLQRLLSKLNGISLFNIHIFVCYNIINNVFPVSSGFTI